MAFPTTRDRMTVIRRFAASGSVLDLGCVDSRPARHSARQRLEYKPNLLFRSIAQLNPDTLGIDIDAEGVRLLAQQGHNAICADVETMDLGRRFDCIVAGEIIEHLENPGRFLRNMRRHLTESGRLILSTPNPFYQGQVWKIWRYGRPAVHEDHTNWQDPTTLSALLRRTGFMPIETWWVQPPRSFLKTWKRLFRGYFSHGFLIVAAPAAGDTG